MGPGGGYQAGTPREEVRLGPQGRGSGLGRERGCGWDPGGGGLVRALGKGVRLWTRGKVRLGPRGRVPG